MYRIFQYEGSEESRVDKLIGGDPISWLGIDSAERLMVLLSERYDAVCTAFRE